MPLRRAPGHPRPEQNSIVFPMQDTRTGGVVMCRITEPALRGLTGSPTLSMQAMFENCRPRAEELASSKYDRWPAMAVVTDQDIIRASAAEAAAAQTLTVMKRRPGRTRPAA